MSAVVASDAGIATEDPRPARDWPRPSPWLVAIIAAWAVLGLAASLWLVPHAWWWIAGAGIAVLALLDLLLLRLLPTPAVRRQLPDVLPLGVQRDVALELRAPRRVRVAVHDLHPGAWFAEGLPRRMTLPRDRIVRFNYRLRPSERGNASFGRVQLVLSSPLRLWRQARLSGETRNVRVFPNFAPLTHLALLGAEQASRMVGVHIKRRRGEGTDFHQMREYREGDSLRQIDWKASSRVGKLISREYQDEKNQQVILCVDTGRRMLARDGELSHFDRTLDAALVVSYLALRQGDAVGLFASGGERRWVSPQRGMGAIDTLLAQTYDLQPQPVATDFLAAAAELSRRQRRRGLLIWVTNLRDEDSDDMLAAIRMLQSRHLVIVASLREQALDIAANGEVHELEDALCAGAAARYLQQRAAVHDALRRQRVTVLDVTCEELPGALVERYLRVKREGLL
ncbi:MAG: DUF58 domain-containing protein [Proteobacteria bacterium]|nr:DUF58 domain-containing protein [Pseudomonadota bacterium]